MNVFKKLGSIFHRTYIRNMCSLTSESEVIFEVTNENVGIITLNRPKALNSLNESMVKNIYCKLKEWEPTISFVVVKGNGGKAFCAGGDVVAITKGTPKNSHIGKSFFRNEYKMNYLIATYKRPYISLIDGVTMGGGVGLSVHGSYRIATEKTLFAMPETAIGLCPDVGGTFVLPRLKGHLGMYLGLTGHRLQGIDVVKAGIATHFINSKDVTEFFENLRVIKSDNLEKFLKQNTLNIDDKEFSLNSLMDKIEQCFSGNSLEAILENLKKDNTPWSIKTYENLLKMSPIALKTAKKAIDLGATRDIRQCLITEYKLSSASGDAKVSTDFYEGVRALLIDKDKNPKWNPASISEVTDEMVEKCFESDDLLDI